MRRLGLALVITCGAIATGALATPAQTVAPSWADWVGDWQGKLAWTTCTIDGEPAATVAVEATDGVVSIELAPAGLSLGKMTLVDDNGGWSGRSSDVAIHVERSPAHAKGDAIELAIDLDSGCTGRGTLRRASVGIAGCDRLAAWARIEGRCTRLSRPPLENAARLVRQQAEWLKATGAARTKVGSQCEARATRVASELVDAGCAPNPDPTIGFRGAECQALRATSSKAQRCGNLPSDLRAQLEREVVVLLAAVQGADEASLPIVDAECREARDRILGLAQQAGCPP